MPPLTLRDATLADAPLMTDLIRAAFEDYRDKMTPPSGAHNETPEKILAKLQEGGGIIAYVDAAAAGCVVYYPEEKDQMYLGRLAVLPTYRQHGVGQALVAAVENKAQMNGYTRMSLSVRMGLPRNRAFFERMGYSVTSYETHDGHSEPTFMHLMKPLT
ncbi:MAG: GNAT family N-acetyltransferase [Chloroflexota bacterium]